MSSHSPRPKKKTSVIFYRIGTYDNFPSPFRGGTALAKFPREEKIVENFQVKDSRSGVFRMGSSLR